MGSPVIFYNSKTITFPEFVRSIQPDPLHNILQNRSASGTNTETLNVSVDVSIGVAWIMLENATQGTLKRNLQQWFQWAQAGGAWSFAMDSSDTVLDTLASPAAIGDTSIVLTSGAGVVAGRQYVLRVADTLALVQIASISGSPTMTLAESLDFALPVSARFRSERYWPGRLIASSGRVANPIVEVPPLHFNFNLSYIEDMG